MGNIFKGFKQVKEGASFENGYIYFVRNESNTGATDGYIYFNGKKYGTGEEVRDFIGSLPSGSGDTVIEYIQNLGIDLAAQIGAEEAAREEDVTTLQTSISNLSSATETAIATAKQEAIDAASEDTDTKVATESANRESADNELSGRIDALDADTHTHDNKSVLDEISSTSVEKWNAAEQNAMDHADGIVSNEATTRAEADTTLQTNINNLSSATVTAIATAKQEAIDAASEDTDTKVAAEASARTEADTALSTRISELESLSGATHTHSNKEVLDGITAAKVEVWDASAHTHSNKAVLDGIDAEKVSSWDAAEQNAKNYADGLDQAMDARVDSLEAADITINGKITELSSSTETAIGRIDNLETSAHTHDNKDLLDTYTQTEADLEDAVAKKHEHANKTVLDGITAEQVSVWNASAHTHSNKTVLDGITAEKVSAWDAAEENANAYTNSSLTAYATSADTVDALETLSGNTTVTVVTGGSSESILKSYTIKQGETNVATIDIPKDLVVSGGEVVDISGVTYLQLTIANSDQKVNIQVGDLCDVYTGDNTTIEVSTGNVISVKDNVFDAAGAAATAKSEAITAATAYTDTQLASYATSANTVAAINAEMSARTAADEALDARIDALEDLSGSTNSALQQIDAADNSVTIGTKTSEKHQTVAVNISPNADNALELKTNGLFAAIYYDGDDVN